MTAKFEALSPSFLITALVLCLLSDNVLENIIQGFSPWMLRLASIIIASLAFKIMLGLYKEDKKIFELIMVGNIGGWVLIISLMFCIF